MPTKHLVLQLRSPLTALYVCLKSIFSLRQLGYSCLLHAMVYRDKQQLINNNNNTWHPESSSGKRPTTHSLKCACIYISRPYMFVRLTCQHQLCLSVLMALAASKEGIPSISYDQQANMSSDSLALPAVDCGIRVLETLITRSRRLGRTAHLLVPSCALVGS